MYAIVSSIRDVVFAVSSMRHKALTIVWTDTSAVALDPIGYFRGPSKVTLTTTWAASVAIQTFGKCPRPIKVSSVRWSWFLSHMSEHQRQGHTMPSICD